jgi:hypothetical protein
MGSSISVRGTVLLGGDNSYIRYNSGIELTVGGNRALSATSSGGVLHGNWLSQTPVGTSDRRLKDSIDELDVALPALVGSGHVEALGDDPVSWVLRELRPVAFRFKRGAEAKMRMGFLADEIGSVLPDMVRTFPSATTSDVPSPQGVVYQDLIALLVAGQQQQQRRIVALESAVSRLLQRVDTLAGQLQRVDALELKDAHIERRLDALEGSADDRRWREKRRGA